MVALTGAAGADPPQAGKLQDRRCCRRASILAGMWEVVVLPLGSQTGLVIDLCTHGIGVQAVHPLAPDVGFDTSFRRSLERSSKLSARSLGPMIAVEQGLSSYG